MRSPCVVEVEQRREPIDRVASIAGDPMAGSHDAPELLGVDVQQLARCGALIANDVDARVERSQARQAQALEHAADGRNAATDDAGNDAHRPTITSQSGRIGASSEVTSPDLM